MIDRKNIIRLIEEKISVCESVNQCYRTIDLPALRDILALLKENNECENCAMAIEDRQLVVRCKDCCFFRRSKTIAQHSCVLHESRCQENDFCSWAVKKNNDND